MDAAGVNLSTCAMKTLSTAVLILLSSLAGAEPNQSIKVIQDQVDSYLRANLDSRLEHKINISPIDPHLQLPACAEDLKLSSPSGAIKPGLNTISVNCPAEKGWTIYSTASIKAFLDVLVASKPIQRNEVIRAEHLSLEKRDVGTLQQGFVVDRDDVLSKQAIRNIAVGSVLTRNQFADLTLVKRGEQVSIQSGREGFLISAPGIAMMDGSKGQQIRVKNTGSQRIVQAVVVEAGIVGVFF